MIKSRFFVIKGSKKPSTHILKEPIDSCTPRIRIGHYRGHHAVRRNTYIDGVRKLKNPPSPENRRTSGLKNILDKICPDHNKISYDTILKPLTLQTEGPGGDDDDDNDLETTSIIYDYPVNRATLNNLKTYLEFFINKDIESQKSYLECFPSMCEGIVVINSPLQNTDLYVEAIVRECTSRCGATFIKLSNIDLFHRISPPLLLKYNTSLNKLDDISYSGEFNLVSENRTLDNINRNNQINHFFVPPDSNIDFNYSSQDQPFSKGKYDFSATKINNSNYSLLDSPYFEAPYPWFTDYSQPPKATPPSMIRKNIPISELNDSEKIISNTLSSLFSQLISASKPNQSIVLFHEDIWNLVASGSCRLPVFLSLLTTQLWEVRRHGIKIIFVSLNNHILNQSLSKLTRNNCTEFEDGILCVIKNFPSYPKRFSLDKFRDENFFNEQNTSDNAYTDNGTVKNSNNSQSIMLTNTYIPFSSNILGIYNLDLLLPLDSQNSIDLLNKHLIRDASIVNIRKNLTELKLYASQLNANIDCTEEYIISHITSKPTTTNDDKSNPDLVTKNTNASDPVSVFSNKVLHPKEIEKFLLICLNIYEKKHKYPTISPIQSPFNSNAIKNKSKAQQISISYDIITEACRIISHSISPNEPRTSTENSTCGKSQKCTVRPQKMTKAETEIYNNCYFNSKDRDFRFTSVGGLAECKRLIKEVIEIPLLHPSLFTQGIFKNNHTTGLLLFGPPGTGKTFICKTIASELNVNLLNIKPSSINSMWVGETEKNISAIFSLARKLSPCIIFIDEVDGILNSRTSYGPKYYNSSVDQFMQEWDGLASDNKGIIILGTTNRPFDLDEASLRRFPRRILIDIPSPDERKEILSILLEDENLSLEHTREELITKIVELTDNFTGSDLRNLCLAAVYDGIEHGGSIVAIPSEKNQKEQVNVSNNDIPTSLNQIQEPHTDETLTNNDTTKTSDKFSQACFQSRVTSLNNFLNILNAKKVTSSLSRESEILSSIRSWNKTHGSIRGNSDDYTQTSWGF